MSNLIRWLALVALAAPCAAQDAPADEGERWAGAGRFDPGPGQPGGRISPLAPPETAEFAFMLGSFRCHHWVPREGEGILEFDSYWNASYVLNGMGVQDHDSGPRRSTTSLRVYDDANEQWVVTYTTMPNFFTGVWTGGLRNGEMVLERESIDDEGFPVVSRLTFYDIENDAYKWKSERVTPHLEIEGWRKSCVRVDRPPLPERDEPRRLEGAVSKADSGATPQLPAD